MNQEDGMSKLPNLSKLCIILLLVLLSACNQTSIQTNTTVPTDTPEPSKTIGPTITLRPTKTPAPTKKPTSTPLPPTATPEPVTITGSGDSVVDIENPYDYGIVHITGNASSRHFAVENYGSDGKQIDLLVNTTDPYDGVRPLDFGSSEHTTRFQVTAVGDWEITILPLDAARVLFIPGKIEGKGDDVIILIGTPDLAKIKGNVGSRHFAVLSHGNGTDLLVNTTDPYEGTVMIASGMIALEIDAEGEWEIEVTGK